MCGLCGFLANSALSQQSRNPAKASSPQSCKSKLCMSTLTHLPGKHQPCQPRPHSHTSMSRLLKVYRVCVCEVHTCTHALQYTCSSQRTIFGNQSLLFLWLPYIPLLVGFELPRDLGLSCVCLPSRDKSAGMHNHIRNLHLLFILLLWI